MKAVGEFQNEMMEPGLAHPPNDTSKEALHVCLEQIKSAGSEEELRRLTDELQKIVFQRQYRNA